MSSLIPGSELKEAAVEDAVVSSSLPSLRSGEEENR